MANLRLEMTFKNSEGRSSKISVDDAKADLTEQEINDAMDEILDKNIFTSNGGEFIEKTKAELITTQVTEFNML